MESLSESKSGTTTEPAPSFWRAHGQKVTAVLFWALLIGGYWWYARSNGLTIRESMRLLAELLTASAFGPILYMVIYALRPLILFPATLLTLSGGFLFGPVFGVLYTVLGANASAMIAFVVGRYFGQGVLDAEESEGIIQRYASRMRANSFESVLLMRLLFLPYDLVNYIAGFLRIDWKAFLLATIIGSIPGTISFVLLGNSFGTLEELLAGEPSLNPWALGASIALILVSIAISRLLRRREAEG